MCLATPPLYIFSWLFFHADRVSVRLVYTPAMMSSTHTHTCSFLLCMMHACYLPPMLVFTLSSLHSSLLLSVSSFLTRSLILIVYGSLQFLLPLLFLFGYVPHVCYSRVRCVLLVLHVWTLQTPCCVSPIYYLHAITECHFKLCPHAMPPCIRT